VKKPAPACDPDINAIESMSEEELDASLREMGLDPDEVAARTKLTVDACRAAMFIMREVPGVTLDNVTADHPDHRLTGLWIRRVNGQLSGYLYHRHVILFARLLGMDDTQEAA
jgi:hypothetical protein